jgi:hypothetical protein
MSALHWYCPLCGELLDGGVEIYFRSGSRVIKMETCGGKDKHKFVTDNNPARISLKQIAEEVDVADMLITERVGTFINKVLKSLTG